MTAWNIYKEPADTDTAPELIGSIDAASQSEALQLAAQYYETPEHDITARPSDLDKSAEPAMEQCPYCRSWHPSGTSQHCPQNPNRKH